MSTTDYSRRRFLQTTGAALGGSMLVNPAAAPAGEKNFRKDDRKMRAALVGTGVRGLSMYGRELVEDYGDYVELVGICDQNPGRLEFAEQHIRPPGPGFTDVEEMLRETEPEVLIVTTWDWTHHDCIIAGLEHGADVICEKPLTIDEEKAQAIRDAEQRTGRKVIVTFNYRYAPLRSKIKELLMENVVGDLTTVDLLWNIDHPHLQRYMMRWHGEMDKGGSLWVHKSTHHFDLLNWWLDSDPVSVHALSDLERFGEKGPFRGNNCRDCPYTSECDYYWDITEDEWLMNVYVNNEEYDGYIRDNCVFREEIDTYDKHAALIKYANNVYVNYSLTGDTDHSGFWLAFNGTKGRMEIRESGWSPGRQYEEIVVKIRGQEPYTIAVPHQEGGHWGGDPILMNDLFVERDPDDPLKRIAGSRDGVMSISIGIAARKSAEENRTVEISELTDIRPQAVRPEEE